MLIYALLAHVGLLRNIDQLEILKDEMELNEGLAHIARKAVDNSPLFLPIVKEVIAYRVKNCFDNGGFRVGTFKLKRSSPELLALFEAANTKEFASVIRCSPRLTQIDGDDVFFSNKDLIDFDSIAELAKAKKNPEIDASWRSLIALMQRSKTSENEEYSPQEQGMKLSVGKVHTLLQSCIGQIASGCKPVVEAAPSADDTIAGGLKIMCEKASHFRAGAQGTSNHRGNGLHFLQERVWESLIALILMDYSVESQEKGGGGESCGSALLCCLVLVVVSSLSSSYLTSTYAPPPTDTTYISI
ncbi:hypothetical protein PtA15_6A884 [Puccinia triticina]|uniref:Uncharacterized protein n=1 Tax=Puccinia triticina TaxID=208348 RepID=A0ABY7CQI8_9BASI|nr:uncharacterized protein PtA15_6A884 [Puccinia triticina]WAQ86252.1 hypothetical protein PtA15_6A884 [Puccinia triticina]